MVYLCQSLLVSVDADCSQLCALCFGAGSWSRPGSDSRLVCLGYDHHRVGLRGIALLQYLVPKLTRRDLPTAIFRPLRSGVTLVWWIHRFAPGSSPTGLGWHSDSVCNAFVAFARIVLTANL